MTKQSPHFIRFLCVFTILVILSSCDHDNDGPDTTLRICDLDVATEVAGRTEAYRVLVFGSLEPAINQEIADFLNAQPDIFAQPTDADLCVIPENLVHFNVVIDYDHDGLAPEQEIALAEFAALGGKIIALHHAIYDPLDFMFIKREIYGATLPSHCCDVEEEPYQVIMTDPLHPVFDSLPSIGTVTYGSALVPEDDYPFYELLALDERYSLITFQEGGNVNILLSTIFAGGNYDIGWWRTEGAGVVFYYQMGHLQEMFTDPWYQQLIINTIRFDHN